MAVATELPRLNNQQLTEIGQRLRSPLTDEGARAWYKADVTALVDEVIALRRERAAAMAEFAAHPPLEGIDQNLPLNEVAERLTDLWVQQQQGLWQKAEVKKLRDRLAIAEQAASSAEAKATLQGEQIAALQARQATLAEQMAQTARESQAYVAGLQEAVAKAEAESKRVAAEQAENTQMATRAINSTRADAQRRLDAKDEELRQARAEIQSMREEVGQAITANQQAYAARADRARDMLRDALKHFEN